MPGMRSAGVQMSGTGGSSMAGMANMNHGDMASNGSMDMMMGMSPMKMYFHIGTDETILFKGWKTENGGELFGSMLAVAMMAVLFEAVRVLRLKLLSTPVRKLPVYPGRQTPSRKPSDKRTLESGNKTSSVSSNSPGVDDRLIRMSFADRLVHACLKMLQFGLGYILMLVVMTYNVWLYFAIIIGFGTGFTVFYKQAEVYTKKAGRALSNKGEPQQADAVELKDKGPPSDATMY